MSTSSNTALEFQIKGMDCGDCALTLERGVCRLSSVRSASVDFATAKMRVLPADGALTEDEVIAQVRRLGYDVSAPEAAPDRERRGWSALLAYLRTNRRAQLAATAGLLALAGGALSLAPGAEAFRVILLVGATLVGLVHPARAGWGALRSGRGLDINVLMTLAALGALALDELAEAATVMALFNLGEVLEAFTLDRTRASVKALVHLAPSEAALIAADHERQVPVDDLRPGDKIRVRPGERLPADGVIAAGESALDESPITGESMPVDKGPGDPVFAGSINGNGSMVVEVTRARGESTLARIAQLVEQAQRDRGRSQRLVDRFSRWYTPAVVLAAALVATVVPWATSQPYAPWYYRALVLLVVSCPCALVISTPVSILAGLARAARLGVLIKGGGYLEKLAGIRVMAFDKTGTLTRGRPSLQQIIPDDDRLLALAAAVEHASEHPLALAIRREARHRQLAIPTVEDFVALPGRGARARMNGRTYTVGSRELWPALPPGIESQVGAIESRGQTALVFGDESGPLAVLALADAVRPESASAVARLNRIGIDETVLLTGDNARTAAAIARLAGVKTFEAGLMPDEKASIVARLIQRHGETVAMVGDGINDAPALARASLGIAMGAGGTDAALETSSIALMHNDLHRIPSAIRLARATRAVIVQNVALSIGSKLVFIVLTVLGLTTLWLAVFADMGASLLVTLNGMRLLRFPLENE